ncbi:MULTISPECIES: capsule polysaccharide transporter [unclassified Leisingera]|uniref:capsule polysaccharide transporter n=1 Tax=unclassified Leisingera TaxID=2614906 RepID=UPI0002D28C31|nr:MULTISPECIES: capsule polysaccharide transporter [unclassified Leisingera]KIC23145.1 capsule biosynthesis protein [Leisingera sp. ANG-S3]KIC49417.1 capsule biosynthesis protein [Leisingera sp. ANG-S]KID09458.1 capsule biosynthesis protein [Leisingera sp. ANG1]
MTTKPRAKKFRIRRSASVAGAEAQPQAPEQPRAAAAAQPAAPAAAPSGAATAGDGDGGAPMSGMVSSPRETRMETDIDAIRQEGLTGRQLRLARRMAQKHNLPATSDFEAVRMLRERGIDPFKRANMLELVVPQNKAQPAGTPPAPGSVQLPQTVPAGKTNLPSTELSPAERRAREIQDIQRDIARRRRRKLSLLAARLAFFVMLPTLAAGYYFYSVATPMFSSKSEFLVLKADSAAGGVGGLLSGTQFATSQDSIAVQSYLMSKEAMLRLDDEVGFKAHFTQEWLDPIQRLESNPTNEEAYATYNRNVKIGYDPTEGVVRMEVSAADPEVAAEFSRKLISYAQEKVNNLSQQKRADQMSEAEQALLDAEAQRRAAQERLVVLQQQGAVLDPEGVVASLRTQISTFEIQLEEKRLELAALQDNARPNRAKVSGAEADIRRLEAVISSLNNRMVDASAGENSLANLRIQIQMAQADLATRDLMLQSALQQVETTRLEANRQVRYLTTAVEPVASDEPSYPRKFENTVLAFLIFSGIYLMCSLTASILREQVSS